MAINKLNLQIGGSDNSHHKEVEKLEESIDISIDQLLAEEFGEELELIDPEAPVEEEQPAPQQIFMEDFGLQSPHIEARHTRPAPEPERQKTGVDAMAESMSAYHKKIDYAHKDAEIASDGDRIKLLEDAFAQMKRGQPQTLVTGIGASLDSGGGAVWLWDLEDVSIGTPNPQTSGYPAIANGAVLQYNNLTNQWYAGVGSSSTVEVTTAQVDLTNPQSEDDLIPNQNDIVGYTALGTLSTQLDWNKKIYDYFTESLPLKGGTICADATINTGAEDGVLKIQSTGGNTGKLILVNTQGNTSATLSAQLGNANFTSGVTAGVFVQTNATSTSAFTKANFSGLVQLNEDTTVASTKELIFERGNTGTTIGGLVVKGISPSQAEATSPQLTEILNVSYGNTTVGVANALNKGDAINYNGKVEGVYNIANKQYVDSAVAAGAGVAFQFDGTCNVLLPLSNVANADVKENAGYFYINQGAQGAANSEWTGISGLVIATNQLIIWSATENRWFAGAIEDNSAYLLRSAGTNQKVTGTLYINRTSGSNIILQKSGATTANLYADGSANFTKVTSSGQIIGQTNIQSNDYISAGSYLQANSYLTVKANSNLNNDTDNNRKVSIARAGNNSGAYVNFEILGNNCVNAAGTSQSAMLNTYINNAGSTQADYIRYHGRTDVNDAPQTRSSCDARYPRLTGTNNFSGFNTFKEIVLQDTTTSSLTNYLLLCKTKTGTPTVEIMAEKGHVLLKKGGSELQVVRGDTSGGDSTVGGINLQGCQPGSASTNNDLLRCKYYVNATSSSNQVGDAVEYFGRQDLDDCIMSRSNISTLISDTIDTSPSWLDAYSTGTIFDSSSYVKYRIINNNTIQLIIRLSNGGVNILNNQTNFTATSSFTTALGQTVFGAFQVVTKEREVLQASIDMLTKKLTITPATGGTQDVQGWASLPYGKP